MTSSPRTTTRSIRSPSWTSRASRRCSRSPRTSSASSRSSSSSPWTENFSNIGSATGQQKGGDFAIVGPDFKGKLPKGVKRVKSPYDRVWLIGRTYIKGEQDTKKVNRIQDSYGLVPLSKYGKDWTPKNKGNDTTVDEATIPGLGPGDDPLEFYTALNDADGQVPAARGRSAAARPAGRDRCRRRRAPDERRHAPGHARRDHPGPGEHPGQARRPLHRPDRRSTTAT